MIARRASLGAIALILGSGCAPFRPKPYAAFEEYRVVNLDEAVSLRPASQFAIQKLSAPAVSAIGIPLQLSLERHVHWMELADQVWVNPAAERRMGSGPRRIFLVGQATAVKHPVASDASTLPYIFPLVEQTRILSADLIAGRDSARGSILEAVAPPTASPWLLDRESFYIPGVEAIAIGGSARVPDLVGADAVFDPAGNTALPVRRDRVPGDFIVVRGGFARSGLDSIRILGSWYRPRDTRWIIRRPSQDSLTVTLGRVRLSDFPSSSKSELLEALARAEADFLRTLDATDARTAPVLVVCVNEANPDTPCVDINRRYRLSVLTENPSNPLAPTQNHFPFRVLRQSRSLGIAIGVVSLLVFVGASTY